MHKNNSALFMIKKVFIIHNYEITKKDKRSIYERHNMSKMYAKLIRQKHVKKKKKKCLMNFGFSFV